MAFFEPLPGLYLFYLLVSRLSDYLYTGGDCCERQKICLNSWLFFEILLIQI